MAQIENRFNLRELTEEMVYQKKLPNFFAEYDDLKPTKGIAYSVIFHIIFSFLLVVIAAINSLIFPHLPKPELPNRDIEFKLVQNESKPPIDKNTKIRSDRDSQAGGKHDPTKKVSEPSKKAATPTKSSVAQKPQPKKQPLKQQQKVIQKPIVKPQAKPIVKPQAKPVVKPQVKPVVKPAVQPQQKPMVTQQPIAKPTPIKAPSVAKPTVKPDIKPQGVTAPSAPKIATTPKSPFAVPTPPTKAPVGSTYKPEGASASSGQGSAAPSAPAPKFSTSGNGSSSNNTPSSPGSYASRGSSGGGGISGNPSPGNPNGTPGIDAIRQPNWGPYMRDLEQRIKRNWTPPKGDSSKRVVITFTIGRDGRLLSHKITKSSGVPLADRAAMSAIELTAPFRPLPPEFRGQSVPIEFTFDYNVLNSVLR